MRVERRIRERYELKRKVRVSGESGRRGGEVGEKKEQGVEGEMRDRE